MDTTGIAEQFEFEGRIIDVEPYGAGRINDTFLVSLESRSVDRFILQRINRHVFPRPELIQQNLRVLTDHIRDKGKYESVSGRRLQIPAVIPTRNGDDQFIDSEGSFWRAVSFIPGRPVERVDTPDRAREIGAVLGSFHAVTADLEADRLQITRSGFHDTPGYLVHLNQTMETVTVGERYAHEIGYCLGFIGHRRRSVTVFEDARRDGLLPVRTIHGDPKYDNVMMDPDTGQAVGIIDLDTVMPGLVHHDLGDCLRSCCNRAGEDPGSPDEVHFSIEHCRAAMEGYFSEAKRLTDDSGYLYHAVRIIPLELGIRFFTDFLEGNVYFKVEAEEDNLKRALVQFKLTESIERQEFAIQAVIDGVME